MEGIGPKPIVFFHIGFVRSLQFSNWLVKVLANLAMATEVWARFFDGDWRFECGPVGNDMAA